MNIIEAIRDPNLLQPFLGPLDTWASWMTALKVVYGLPNKSKYSRELIRQCTGRDPSKLPKAGFDTALFLTGRRSGKSRNAAVIGSFEAVLAGHEKKLSKGERGVVVICAPSRSQGRIVKDYIRAIFQAPILAGEVAGETKDGFELNSGTRIEILAGDWRTVRGFTVLAAIVDEAAFFGYEADTKIKSDTELIRALQPSLATVGGKLIAISTPYALKGWCYGQYRKHFGNDEGRVLVWNCPSRTMNATLPQSVVDDALAEDYHSAKAEYLGQFRDDVASFLPREAIEAVVARGRVELPPKPGVDYWAFVDISGGRIDDAALAIAHREDRTVVIDLIERHRPPFDPFYVVGCMARTVERYGIKLVHGDNYSAEFVARAFESQGIAYFGPGSKVFTNPPPAKGQLYLELLPRINSREIELLDLPILIDQLAGLERRTRSGGRDIIDHGPNGHDDVANVVAGVAERLQVRKIRMGVAFGEDTVSTSPEGVRLWERRCRELKRMSDEAESRRESYADEMKKLATEDPDSPSFNITTRHLGNL